MIWKFQIQLHFGKCIKENLDNENMEKKFKAYNPINWDLIEIRKFKPEKLKRNIVRKINALDTETLDGYCNLLADNYGNFVLGNYHKNELPNIDLWLNFLTAKRFRSSHNFFFNLNYDVNAIIKYLPKDNLNDIYKDLYTDFNNIRIFYIPKKIFRLTKNKHIYKYYDIFQFFNMSLEKASQIYLGLDKYIENIDGKTLGTDKQYWLNNIDSIIKYCINDCVLTAKLGNLLNETLVNSINLNPCSYISKASICKEFVRKACNIPDILQIPNSALKYAFYSYSGGRFEIIRKGNVGKCSLYDINSAYPFHTRSLLDINKGEWKRVNCLHEKADYGFYFVKILTKYNKISPIAVTLQNGVICYPLVQVNTYISKQELLNYEPYIEYEIIDGWEFYASEYIYPFKDYIDKIHKQKQITDKDNYEYSLYKILMNSLYGSFYEKTIQKEFNDKLITKELISKCKYDMELVKKLAYDTKIYSGKLFNPIYASLITCQTRIDLFKTAIPYQNDIVGFATDSILFKGNPEIKISNELGGWNLEKFDKSIVLRSGIYKIGKDLKSRGIRKTANIKTPYGSYKDIFDYINLNPELTKYPIIMNRPLTFIEVLLHHLKHEIADINVFVDMEYMIDINKDHKRLWEGMFKNGKELFNKEINSNPLIIDKQIV